MKAMKKILFLVLVLAFTLTAAAFAEAGSNDTIVLTESQIVDLLEGKKDCPVCATGTVNLRYSVQEWTCDQAFQMTVECLNADCALAKHGKITVAVGPMAHKPATTVGKYSDATCVKPGTAVEETYCSRCGKTLETVELESTLVSHILLDDAATYVINNGGYTNPASKIDAWFDGKVAGETVRNDLAKAIVDRFNAVKRDVLNDVDSTYARKYAYDAKHVTVEFKAATCTEDGYIKATCDLCGNFVTKKIAKLGHNVVNTLWIPASCETDAAVAHFCSCGYYEVEVTDARLGHTYYDKNTFFVQNGKEIADFDKVVACQPFDVKAACDRAGEIFPITCQLSDAMAGSEMTAEKLLELAQKVLGTDVELFYADKVLCFMCKESMYLEKNVTEFTHEDDDFFTNRAKSTILYENPKTCTEPYELKVKCTECNFVDTYTEEALGHKWNNRGEVITAATCEEQGISKVNCLRQDCDATTEIKTPAAGHKVTTYWDPEASCTTPGYKVTTCVVCEKEISREYYAAKHTVGSEYYAENCTQINGVWVANTCEVDGILKYTCTKCNKAQEEIIKAPKHNFDFENIYDPDNTLYGENGNQTPWWVKEIIAPTCKNEGSITVWCKNDCGKTSTLKTSDKLAHNYIKDLTEDIPSTCTVAGKGHAACEWCGRYADIDLPLAKHTLLLNGDNTLSCANCDYTEKFDFEVEYKVNLINATITATSTSGTGHIEVIEGKHADRPLFARINFNYTLDNGESVAYVACVEIDKHGDFRMASPACPYGATLTNICVVVTTASDAQDLVLADVPNLGMTIVR